MSKFCLSRTSNSYFSTLLFSNFILFCYYILTHPLCFSYFIFFSLYLLKLLLFLSPLFITTSLLFLALLTVSPDFIDNNTTQQGSDSDLGFLLCMYNLVLDTLRSSCDGDGVEFHFSKEVEPCEVMVFDTSSFKVEENPVEVSPTKYEKDRCFGLDVTEVLSNVEEYPFEGTSGKPGRISMDGLLQEREVYEAVTSMVGGEQVEPMATESNEAEENQDEQLMGIGSEELSSMGNSDKNGGQYTSTLMENAEKLSPNLGRFGSLRKEKEWKRTLACKLYEERQSVDEGEGEGMDLLWERYEADSSKVKVKEKTKKSEVEDGEEDEEEEEEEEIDGQLCCLQALRFSTGKMKVNMGLGRPNLIRISKALKGIGWFHHVSRNNSRKGVYLG